MKKGERSPFTITFSLTLISLFIFLLTEPALSGAGDRNISGYLAAYKIKPGFFFISPALAAFLRTMNNVFNANWWSVFSVIVMFAGLFIFLWFINRRNQEAGMALRLLLAVLFAVFFCEAILKFDVNFTQTAVIAGLSGIVLMADCCYEETRTRRRTMALKTVLGIGFLFLAGSVRWKALLLMLPFGVMCLLYIFIMPIGHPGIVSSLKRSFTGRKVILGLALLIIGTVFLSEAVHKLYGVLDPDLKEYVEANALRENICDYPERYPRYEEAEEEYAELGITASWITMVNTFLTADLNHFSSQDLRKMTDLRMESKMTVKDFAQSLKGHRFLWIIIIIMVGYIIWLKGIRNVWLPLVGCIAAFILCAFYFVYIGRFGWRVTNGCILACIISFIAMSAHPVSDNLPGKKSDGAGWLPLMLSVMLCMIWVAAVKAEKQFVSFPAARVTDEEQAAVLEYINGNPDKVYVGVDKTLSFYRAYSMWASHEPDYLKNAVSLTAHFIIGEKETLADAEIENLFDDMLEKPGILLNYSSARNPIVYHYIRDYYDPCVTITAAESYGEVEFLRYTKPVEPVYKKDYNGDVVFEIAEKFSEDETIAMAINVNCNFSTRGGIETTISI